jgi:glycosyltransferase involved in cell wall biosynthesis
MKKISIIIPCFNEQETLKHFYKEAVSAITEIKEVTYELIFIDDGSSDRTLSVIEDLQLSDPNVRFMSFSRNFGKEAAILAGLKKSAGDYVAIMDADLQDPPSLLKEMFECVEDSEYDCCATRRANRKGESKIKSFFAYLFYWIINKLSDIKIVSGARDFRLMSRQMVNAIIEISEYNRFSKGIFSWVGFNTKWLEYENIERFAGQTKWSFFKLLAYSIEGIVAFSVKPLILSSVLGLLFCIISMILIIVLVIKTLLYGDPVAGFPALVCVIMFLGGWL